MSYLGIRGFESVLRGGIPDRAEVLFLAPEGPERYLVAAHYVVEGLKRGERVLLVLSGEAPDAFLARLGRMGIDAAGAIASGAIVLVDWFTGWTQALEGVVEDHRTLRASRKVEDLVSAIQRALPVLRTSPSRRAFVDILPLALKAFDEVQAVEALASVRAAIGEDGLRVLYNADRTMPAERITTLIPSFHAVLDARGEGRDRLAIAVLGIGGVALTPRYIRVQIREGGASVETEPSSRTFSCPICGARVQFSAGKCPSCGTSRAQMTAPQRRSGVMDYVESLGRGAGAERGRVSPTPEPKPAGLTNGVRSAARPPGRVNGSAPGRVNGIGPAGRTNGVQTPIGRTNGLVNGLRRARKGVTNGLTNGSGFTNGLGAGRARFEVGRTRWKIYVVPLLAATLLLSPLLLNEQTEPSRFTVDGVFDEWAPVSGYTQAPPPGADRAVALTGYKVAVDHGAMHLYATVLGDWFSDAGAVHVLYAFIDRDQDRATGYRVQGLGADELMSIEGSGGFVTGASLRAFSGPDPYNWSAWQSAGSASATTLGGELEAAIPWSYPPEPSPAILLLADDGATSRVFSAVAFGTLEGALRATVRLRSNVISNGTPDVLAVDLEAVGGPVEVQDLDVTVVGGAAVLKPQNLPLRLEPGQPQSLTVRMDTRSVPSGGNLTARVTRVVADRPVLLSGGPFGIYVGTTPTAGKRVDGWFEDWTEPEFSNDSDPGGPSVDADRDLQRFAASRQDPELFLYADVRGGVFAGSAAPVRRVREAPGGPAQSGTGIPHRVVGEDILQVYVDLDRNTSAGIPILGLRGADLLLEVRGVQGTITAKRAYEWTTAWSPLASPQVGADEHRVEAVLPLSAAGSIQVAFQTVGWDGPADSTDVVGTRGVLGDGDGYRYFGNYAAEFASSGRVRVSAGSTGLSWSLPSLAGPDGWKLTPTPTGVQFRAPGVEVLYSPRDYQLKEEVVLLASLWNLQSLEFPFSLDGDALLWDDGGGSTAVYSGSDRTFELAEPFAVDANGVITPLALRTDLAAGRFEIAIPSDLMSTAAFPLIVDPVVNYTLRNDGSTYKAGEHLGYSVAIGDFNDDGYADVLSGAPDNSLGGNAHGYAYIFMGPFTADRTAPDVSINGTTSTAQFGFSVAAGKFNNDNYWDAIVARKSNSNLGVTGNVSIYYGSASFDTTVDVQFTPPGSPQNFGWWVAAGNVDNAFYDDVLIGEEARDDDGGLSSQDGAAFLYKSPFGSTVTTANYTLLPITNTSGHFGRSIAVGKIDSDAYPDVVVGEPLYSSNSGRLSFFKGSQLTSGSGNRYPIATITAPSGGGSTVQFSASLSIGRLNGDAYGDLVAGAPLYGSSDDGRAYIFLANSDGSGLSGGASPSVTLSSQSGSEQFGASVLIADFSDDGTADALVGAPLAAGGGTARGRAYWFDDPLTDQTADATLGGAQNTERYGFSLAGGKFGNDLRTVVGIGAYLWDKNSGNPNDNDGRVIVATVPEAPLGLLAGVGLAVAIRTRQAGRRRRQR